MLALEFRHAKNRRHLMLLAWRKIDCITQDVARLDTEKLSPFAVTQVSHSSRRLGPRVVPGAAVEHSRPQSSSFGNHPAASSYRFAIDDPAYAGGGVTDQPPPALGQASAGLRGGLQSELVPADNRECRRSGRAPGRPMD